MASASELGLLFVRRFSSQLDSQRFWPRRAGELASYQLNSCFEIGRRLKINDLTPLVVPILIPVVH